MKDTDISKLTSFNGLAYFKNCHEFQAVVRFTKQLRSGFRFWVGSNTAFVPQYKCRFSAGRITLVKCYHSLAFVSLSCLGTASRTSVTRVARRRRRVERLLFTREKRRSPPTAHDQIRIKRNRPTPTPPYK